MTGSRTTIGTRLAVAFLIAVALVVGGAAAVAEGGDPGSETFAFAGVEEHDRLGAEPTHATADAETIELRNELFRTEERGTVGVTARLSIPDRVTELRITLLSERTGPAEADGFERDPDAEEGRDAWVWDGETDRPSITYAMVANDTVDGTGPLAAGGTYRFVDAGDWALVRTPRADVTGRFTGGGQVRIERENVVEGEGVASRAIAFLGPHEEHVHEAAGQRFRLVVPHAADPAASSDEVFEAFEGTATALQVGARDDEVFAVAAPGDVSWAVRGLQTGDADLWVRDEEPAATADDIWSHEYVHTRQSYEADPSVAWFTEGSATYYAALFALERGATDFDGFERTLARGEREPAASSVLSDPDAWEDNADYTKGSLVAGEIDRRIRLATDGEASLATVFRDLNDADGPVTGATFLDGVESAAAAGGDAESAAAVRDEAERLTTTNATPDTWDMEAHEAAFGATPAQVGYGLDADGVRATGEHRNRTVARDPVQLVTGETLDLTLLAQNTGGVDGSYELSLTIDGEAVDARSGTVAAGGESTERFEHAFTEPGEYAVRVGSETLTVVVSEPAPVAVRDVAASPDRVSVGDAAVVSATVGNDDAIPAGGDVTFRVDGEAIATEPVRLDADTAATVEREVVFEDPGTATVSVVAPDSEASTTVTVADDASADGIDDGIVDETVGDVPGFGPAVAVVALLSVTALLARRDGR